MPSRYQNQILYVRMSTFRRLLAIAAIFLTSALVGHITSADSPPITGRVIFWGVAFLWSVLTAQTLLHSGRATLDRDGIRWRPLLGWETFIEWRRVTAIRKRNHGGVKVFGITEKISIPSDLLSLDDRNLLEDWITEHRQCTQITEEWYEEFGKKALLCHRWGKAERRVDFRYSWYLVIIPCMGGFGGIAILLLAMRRYEPLSDGIFFVSLGTGAVLYIIHMALAFWHLGKTRLLWIVFLINIIPSISVPLSILLVLNGCLDFSTPRSQRVVVETKREIPGRSYSWNASFHLNSAQTKPSQIDVSAEEYGQIVPGKTILLLQIKRGLLGFPWHVSHKIESNS